MLIRAEKLRFLTKNGIIYGRADKMKHQNMVVLEGLFSNDSALEKHSDFSIKTTPDQDKQIRDASTLLSLIENESLSLDTISYSQYRGFSLTLGQTKTTVTIGHAPFQKKVARLKTIVDNMERKGRVAKTIELDYDNKAFISEKQG